MAALSTPTPFRGAAAHRRRLAAGSPCDGARRSVVVRNKKGDKKVEVVLQEAVPSIGPAGTIKKVSSGYFRNYLLPNNLAGKVTEQVLAQIAAEEARKTAAAAKAIESFTQARTALEVAKNFIVKKKADDDNTYGRVTAAELLEAIKKQTGLEIDAACIDMGAEPIKELGTFPVTAKLHPEVTASFNVVVQKA